MKTIANYIILGLLASIFVVVSCQKDINNSIEKKCNNASTVEPSSIISIEQATQTLCDFMAETECSMTKTTSGSKRTIASIDKYYHNGAPTKSSGEDVPDAYIVNFENNEGFAVLGAHSWQDDIIAVTEKGSIDPNTLEINPGSNKHLEASSKIESEKFDWYSSKDSDFYFADGDPTILTDLIGKTIMDDGGITPNKYVTKSPILTTTWSQGSWNSKGLYNYYCYKTLLGTETYVYAGCTTAAMAMIIAANKYPQNLIVNGVPLDYTLMTSNKCPISSEEQQHVNLLYGAIFKDIDYEFALPAGTCITAAAAKERFEELGYSNVEVLSYSDYSPNMTAVISEMLGQDKPVCISAVGGVTNGHTWVIDGAKYHTITYLLHCNWGWGGDCNGYFSSSMFNTQEPHSLDEGATNNQDCEFTWHFRVIKYDLGTQESLSLQTLD